MPRPRCELHVNPGHARNGRVVLTRSREPEQGPAICQASGRVAADGELARRATMPGGAGHLSLPVANLADHLARRAARSRAVHGAFAAALALALAPGVAAPEGQALVTSNPDKLKAAFLLNFAHYVTWPDGVFPEAGTPWRICVLGAEPFGEVLERAVQGRTEKRRRFEVVHARSPRDLPPCQMVFIALDDAGRRDALARLRHKPVLTVSDAPGFLEEGGIIRFEVRDRARMSINLDLARASSLAIDTKMLEVADEVVENGAAVKLR